MKWANFCQDTELDPLLVLYRDLVPILSTFARQYWTGALTPSGRQVRSCTVGDAAWSIGQALTAMGAPDPCLTSQGNLYICPRFQYRCYSKQDLPPNLVKATPLQVICHLSSISMELCDPLLMAERILSLLPTSSYSAPVNKLHLNQRSPCSASKHSLQMWPQRLFSHSH